MKCVNDEEKKGFRPLTNRFELKKCQKLEEKSFGDKIRIGSKEKREERSIEMFEFEKNQVDPRVYIK